MTIREDVVASAVAFLQDPNVVSSPVESQLSFLRSKNLTQEEIDAAYARAGSTSPPPSQQVVQQQQQQQQQSPPQQPYYGQYPPQPYGWQPPPPEPPKRDWRDWFIMATVMGGVGYGLYFLTKRYVYPLVSPPTPEQLEKDKATVDEQFEKAFVTLEQLVKDTETLKSSEKGRTEKLDKVLEELESFMRDTKSASRRQEDETDRLRDDMKSLKSALPNAMSAQKEFTDGRLKEISAEVRSLKSLISQRMTSASAASTAATSNPLRPSNSNAFPTDPAANTGATSNPLPPTNATASPVVDAAAKEDGEASKTNGDGSASSTAPAPATRQDYLSSLGGRSSPFGSGLPAGRASIPSWQLSAAKAASGPQSPPASTP
ncbi:hypothetical protein DL766_002718 [Monosporascus sp. MC13-8B]|uniref:Peroxisomal membrane protein PEX14 n=1 Tax=Monosporascus cannonballus TaxID=155416 RepID=A0ABY0HJ46_9PEZI|nr:hypothetical protein DL762_000706 [Monosporascus cannonballus]RYP35004.1 hypothetical protein DL766_002718 [Monosporascus sp. MC13-8B]